MKITVLKDQEYKSVQFPEYKMTYERFNDQLTRAFSPKDLKEYLSLYERAQKDPKSVKGQVEKMLVELDGAPEIYNLLGYIYVRLKKIRKAEKLIIENYQKNPENLFARINYADHCLRHGKAQRVPQVFNQLENLNELYPERKTFHYSEVLGFLALMGLYYLKIGKRDLAFDYCAHAKLIDPEDYTVLHLTRKLSQKSILSHALTQLQKAFYKVKG